MKEKEVTNKQLNSNVIIKFSKILQRTRSNNVQTIKEQDEFFFFFKSFKALNTQGLL